MHKFPHKKKYIHKRLLSIIMRLIVVYTVFNRDFFSCSTIYPMQIDCLILIKLNETKKKVYLDCTTNWLGVVRNIFNPKLSKEFITSQKWLTKNIGQHPMLIIVILTMLSIVFTRTLKHWMTWL
jgi:branched-subunit amino acid transport protein AzlD